MQIFLVKKSLGEQFSLYTRSDVLPKTEALDTDSLPTRCRLVAVFLP